MDSFFYFKAGSSSNYRTKVEKTFILNAHTLTFYLCGLTIAAFFSPIENASLPNPCRYLTNLPFW
jgi:hypothetical protein